MNAKVLVTAGSLVVALGVGTAHADHGAVVLGAAIGGAAGAAVGHTLGGDRGDVIIWSALGGAAGAAIGENFEREEEHRFVHYRRVHPPLYVEEHYVVRPPRTVIYVREQPACAWHPHHPHHHHGHHWKPGWGWH